MCCINFTLAEWLTLENTYYTLQCLKVNTVCTILAVTGRFFSLLGYGWNLAFWFFQKWAVIAKRDKCKIITYLTMNVEESLWQFECEIELKSCFVPLKFWYWSSCNELQGLQGLGCVSRTVMYIPLLSEQMFFLFYQ